MHMPIMQIMQTIRLWNVLSTCIHTYIHTYHCAHFAARFLILACLSYEARNAQIPHMHLNGHDCSYPTCSMFHGPYPTHSIIHKEQGSNWLSLKHCDSLAWVIGYWSELWEFPWLRSKGTCCLCKEWACSLLSSTLSY
jgi:hypothetical protein